MIRRFATLLAAMTLVGTALAACTGRQVDVTTNPEPASVAAVTLRVTNELDQPVNVYVVTGGTEMFVRQVGARTTEVSSVRGVPAGSVVQLRARPVDGRQVYEKSNVTLQAGVYEWRVP